MQQNLALSVGQEVVAGEEAVGELVEVLHHDGAIYLHVRRYGVGLDDLYIPSAAIHQVVANHVYLDIEPATLVGRAWHLKPGEPS